MWASLIAGAVIAATPGKAVLSVDGGLPAADVVDVLRLHAEETAQCFALDGGTPRKGEFARFWWVVDAAGRVTGYGFEDGRTKDNRTVPCLVSGVERWWWPGSADGGTWIRHEFSAIAVKKAGAESGEPALPPEGLAPEVEAHVPELSGCVLESWPLGRPKLEGRFQVELTVGGNGAVLGARSAASSPFDATAIPSCVIASARRWRFTPSPDGGVSVWTTSWVVAPTEQRAKLLFQPDAPAFVLVPSEVPNTAKGGLDRSVILETINRNSHLVKHCYEMALQREPKSGGKLAVAWTIGSGGEVLTTSVAESSVNDPDFERCVLDRVQQFVFPPPVGGGVVKVTFPWIFKAAGQD